MQSPTVIGLVMEVNPVGQAFAVANVKIDIINIMIIFENFFILIHMVLFEKFAQNNCAVI
jgi:hypothetical protein